MGVCLVALVNSTALDILTHEVCKIRPLILISDKLMGLEIPKVACHFMIVAPGYHIVVEKECIVAWENPNNVNPNDTTPTSYP